MRKALALALWGAVLLTGLATFAAAVADPPYSPDSWTYWDLARSFAGTPYQIPVLRAYQTTLPWSNAFPPLWPALNALVATALGTGPITPLLTNVAVFVGFAAACAGAARQVFGAAAPGLLSVLLMLGDASWRDELLAGRPIPLQMAFMAALIVSLAPPVPRHAVAGLLCGLLLATKFDVAPLVAVVGFALFLRPGRRAIPAFLLCAALPPLPWAAFSLLHFGQLYASDGSAIAASVDPAAFTTDFRASWRPTLRDDPAAWARKLWPHAREAYWAFCRSWSRPQAAAALVAVLAGFGARWRGGAVFVLPVMAVGLGASMSSYVVTGFLDERYFAPLRWLAGFAGAGLAWNLLGRVAPSARGLAATAAGLALAVPPLGLALHAGLAWRPGPAFGRPAQVAALARCMAGLPPGRLLFLDDDTAASRFGALTGRPAGMAPRNLDRLDPDDLRTFLTRYGFAAATWEGATGLRRAERLGAIAAPGCDRVATLAP